LILCLGSRISVLSLRDLVVRVPNTRMMSLRVLIACSALMLLFAVSIGEALPATQSVRTIAGSGARGMRDGPAASATFLAPAGIARARDGTIYVCDEAAQRIRAIRNGRVFTLAGSGALGRFGMSVIGGYKDGPANAAQFNHPMGLAVGPDGALYIADTKNKKIRKLAHGFVTTAVAGLASPRDIAFDPQGSLWIADFGVGLKRWTRHGLTTVPIAGLNGGKILSVSVSPDADDPTLMIVTPTLLYEYHINTRRSSYALIANGGVPPELGTPHEFGTPRQIAALGKHQAIFTDPIANNVRYMRFSVPPFIGLPYSTPLAGGTDEDGLANAGFRDGSNARFYRPRGIVVFGNTAFVSDTGNRRIRELRLPRFRTPEYGLNNAESYDRSHYEIALIGSSVAFWNSHDANDSICGAIERRLNSSGSFKRPVRCHSHRIDQAYWPRVEDYIRTFLSFRHVDAYVIFIHPWTLGTRPAVSEAGVARFRASVSQLFKGDTRVLFAWWADRYEVSDNEALVDPEHDYLTLFPEETLYLDEAVEKFVAPSLSGLAHVAQYDLFADTLRFEETHTESLYDTINHETPRGNKFIGEHIADALVRNFGGGHNVDAQPKD